MLSMLGVIRPSLAGRSMMVLLQENAGLCIGPNIKRPRSGRDLKVRRSREAVEMLRASSTVRWSRSLTRRFEAQLHCKPSHKWRSHKNTKTRKHENAKQPKGFLFRGFVLSW